MAPDALVVLEATEVVLEAFFVEEVVEVFNVDAAELLDEDPEPVLPELKVEPMGPTLMLE